LQQRLAALKMSRVRVLLYVALAIAGASPLLAQEEQEQNASNPAQSGDPSTAVKAKRLPKAIAPKAVAAKPVRQAQAAIPALPSPAPAKQLPNGASSITESYGNWTVNCRLNDGQKLCALSQIQGNKQTGQRTFAIELATPKGGKTEGSVLMPFGVKLDAGATMKLDDKDFAQPLHYATCLPEGCLLPVSFPANSIEAMVKAKVLSLTSVSLGNGQAVTFSVSLDGFPAALKRVSELGS